MTPAARRALARVLGALPAWRHHGRRRLTPSHHGRLGVHGEPLRWRRRRRAHFATNGSATGARRAPCPSPFSGQGAATHQRRGGRCQGRAAPSGARVALTEGARQAATLLLRLAGRGFSASWAPPGGQTGRRRRPQPAQAARGLRLEREDGDGAGWAGGRTLEWAPAAASGSRPWLEREEGDPPYAQRGSGATRQGFGGA